MYERFHHNLSFSNLLKDWISIRINSSVLSRPSTFITGYNYNIIRINIHQNVKNERVIQPKVSSSTQESHKNTHSFPSRRNRPSQPSISTTRTDSHPNSPFRLPPPLLNNIPNRQIIPRKRDRHTLRLARCNGDVRETFQNRGRLTGRCWHVQIYLRCLYKRVNMTRKTKEIRDEKVSPRLHTQSLYFEY